MIFPWQIQRGGKPDWHVPDEAALRQWLAAEQAAWAWLATVPDTDVSATLAEVQTRQLSAPGFIAATLDPTGTPMSLLQADAVRKECEGAYGTGNAIMHTDPGAQAILAAAANHPLHALGMLAQALNIPVPVTPPEPAEVTQGRKAWSGPFIEFVVPALQHDVRNVIQQIRDAKANLAAEQATAPLLHSLEAEAERNTEVARWLAFGLAAWTAIALVGVHWIYTQTSPPKGAELWEIWLERLPLYAILMTAFIWGWRRFSAMFAEAWAVAQSCRRRIAVLKVVVEDRKTRTLLAFDDQDRERIRMEIFGDKEPAVTQADTDPLPLEMIGKVVDLAQKLRDLGSPADKAENTAKPPGTTKTTNPDKAD